MKARFQLFTHACDVYGISTYSPLYGSGEVSVADQDYDGLHAALNVRMPRIVETRANLAALNDAALRMLLELSYRQRRTT